MTNVVITVRNAETLAALERLERAGGDLTPAMRQIAQALAHETERNFEAEGRPGWKASERAKREGDNGGTKGKTLQLSGQLAASITTDYSASHALIGSNKAYAAIHQFGGKTKAHTIRAVKAKALAFSGKFAKSVNHPGSDIPARPFLPILADGSLQPEASEEVLDTVLRHLKRAAGI